MNRWQDISISDASLKAEFITKFFNGDYIDAFTIISNNPQLNTKAFVADTINQIATLLLSLENNFQTGVIDYLSQQYSNFQNIIDNYNLKGNWSASTTYQIYNFVTYNNIDYLYINLTPSSGNLPTNTDYWVEINIQGEKGAPGLGVNLQYNWSATIPYNALDVVYYNNALWVARVDNINKIPGSTEEWGTLTGSIVSFYNDGDIDISNLSVFVEPVQVGSGDPSPDNVRPISGWDAVEVQRTGINTWDEEWELGSFNSNGQPSSSSTSIRCKNFIPVAPEQTYYMYSGSGKSNAPWMYGIDKSFLRRSSAYLVNQTFTVPEDVYYIKIALPGSYGTTYNHDISINYPSTDHDYHAYSGNTYAIQLGQTVYGGTLDVTGGTMTVDRRYIVADGVNIKVVAGYGPLGPQRLPIVYLNNQEKAINQSDYDHIRSSYLKTGNFMNAENSIGVGNGGNALPVHIGTIQGTDGTHGYNSDAELIAAANAYLQEHPLQICYKLATPFEITLTPTQIATLVGQNNVWSDVGDVTTGLYKKYWEEFIEFKLASIYTDYVEPSGDNLYDGLIWFEVFNPQNWDYLTNRNYTWNQINANNDTWESVDRGDY